ncbi:MAG: hypothetical protein QOF51_2111 [Chloroflexota bacterium]|nr:hypothetical protein [Chloroflexota bacterium]
MTQRLARLLALSAFLAVLPVGPARAQTVTPTDIVAPQTLAIAVRDSSYDPAYPSVSVGTTVTWVNDDPELHTITSDDGVLNGEIQPRGRYAFTFDQPGVYFYYCLAHDWMIGEITVGDSEPDPSSAD